MTSNFLQRLRDRDKNGGQPLPVSNRVEDEMNRLMTEVGDLAGPSSTLPSSKTSHISSIRHGSGAGSKNSSRRRSTLTDKKKKAFLADARRVRQELRTNSSFGESDLLRTKYVETLEVMSEMNRENDKLKSENLKLRTKINTLEMQDNLMERMENLRAQMQNQEKESLKNETKLKLRIAELERRSEATEKEKNAKIRDIELRTKRLLEEAIKTTQSQSSKTSIVIINDLNDKNANLASELARLKEKQHELQLEIHSKSGALQNSADRIAGQQTQLLEMDGHMQAMDDKIHALQEEKDARNKKDAKKIKRQKVIDELSALNTTLKNDIRGLQDKTQQQSDLISSQDEKIEELNKLTKNIRRKSQLTSQNRLLASNRSKASIADLNTRIEDLTRENGVLTENLDTERQRNIVLSAQIQQYQNTLQQQRRLQQASPRRTEPAALPPPVQAPPPQMATTTATANNSGLDSKRSVFPEFIRVKRENERLNSVIRQLKKRLSDRGIKSSVAASSHSDGNFGTSHARGNSVSSRDVSHGSGIRRSFSSSQKAGEQKVRRPGSRSRQSFPRVK